MGCEVVTLESDGETNVADAQQRQQQTNAEKRRHTR